MQFIQVVPNKSNRFNPTFRNLAYGALLVPRQDMPVPTNAPAAIDRGTLAAFEGTYAFPSSSSRDKLGPFGGVGIEIAMQNGLLKVVSPLRGAPGARAGVMANDIITHLDGEPTQGMSLSTALEKMRGPVNTEVRLRIARKGQDAPIELTIVRAPIRTASVGAEADLQSPSRMASSRSRQAALCWCLISRRAPSRRSSRCRAASSSWTVATILASHFCRMAMARRPASCSIRGPGRSQVSGSTDGRNRRRE
jgi:hypothetical protein